MCSPNIQVGDLSLARKFVHEAGHAVVAAMSSVDPVSIEIGRNVTDEGHKTDAVCVVDCKPGENETHRAFLKRRMTYIYAGIIAEASFEAEEDIEEHAYSLWNNTGAVGDSETIARIRGEAKRDGHVTEAELQTVNEEAWKSAIRSVLENKPAIARVAKAFHNKGSLTNIEIRALLRSNSALNGRGLCGSLLCGTVFLLLVSILIFRRRLFGAIQLQD
jgi:hypothetical protein